MQRKCRIEWCQRQSTPLSLYCRDHLTDAWMNRLPTEDPSIPTWRKNLTARDETWRRAA